MESSNLLKNKSYVLLDEYLFLQSDKSFRNQYSDLFCGNYNYYISCFSIDIKKARNTLIITERGNANMLYFLLICLIFILVFSLFSIIRTIHNINKQIKEQRKIRVSLSNKYIEELAYAINQKDTLHKKLQVQIKQEEEQLKQSISNISHDLRTPLTSLQGYLTLLQECENKQEQEQYLKIIKAKTDYLTELVQEFYDLSVLENEQSDVECERIDINRIVTDCLIEKYYEFGEIQPIIQAENAPVWIYGNNLICKRIIENLIVNALRYSDNYIEVSINQKGVFTIKNSTKSLDNIDVNSLVVLDKIKYKETSTKYAILFVGNTTKGGIIMLKFQDNNTTVIATFEDFILTAYVIIDELYHQFAPPEVTRRRHILNAKLSDSEIITISLCGELAGVDSENAWFSFVKRNYRHLFPQLCSRSRFNRTRRALMQTTELLRQKMISVFPIPVSSYYIVDSFPLAVCKFGRARYCKAFRGHGADYGKCPSKKETYYGYKVHALITLEGYIASFEITPASTDDREGLRDLADHWSNVTILADKGYVGKNMKQEMQEKNICLFALKRSNSKENWPKSVRQLIFKLRRRVETVFSQLSGQLNAERVLAKSFQGLCTRLVNKVLAYNLCIALNSIFGETCELGKIKKLIF